MDEDVTLQRLAYFIAVAEEQSLRQAAARYDIAPPSLSAQIKVLERQLGVTLFARTKRGAELTSVGKQLLPRAKELVASAERLVEYSRNLASGQQGVVSIACYPVHVERFLAAVIGDFKLRNKGIRIDLTNLRDDRRRGLGRTLFDDLLAGEVDVAMGPPHLQLGLTGVRAYDARILLVLPEDHPRRHDPQVPVELLKDQAVLISPPQYFSREKVEAAARAAGFVLAIAAESSSPPALVALAKNGLGWAVLPDDYSVVHHSRLPYPVIVDGEGIELLTPVWLQWRRDQPLSPAAGQFVEYARRWAEEERSTPLSASSWDTIAPGHRVAGPKG